MSTRLARQWRLLIPAILVIGGIAMTLLPQSPSGDAAQPASLSPVSPAGAAPSGKLAAAPSATSTRVPTPAPPTPTPTPYRPLAQPTMPPVLDNLQAPARKPDSPDPEPYTEHVVVLDGASGAILFQRNANQPIAPASLTKIMTAILGIEYGVLTDRPIIDIDARQMVDSTLMGLEPGFDVSFEDLLYGLMLPSGNDAAIAIGRYVAGSDGAFVRMMNEKAAWLGLKNTHFANPHGLDSSGHFSSPYDMVVMSRYAMQYPLFREIVAAKSWDIQGSNIAYRIHNVNPILNAFPGADGVKTGFTDDAGRCIVATAADGGHRVYVGLMRSQAGASPDASLLLNWAFNSFDWPQ